MVQRGLHPDAPFSSPYSTPKAPREGYSQKLSLPGKKILDLNLHCPPTGPVLNTAMKKVLVVEDHPDMRELLIFQMERMGFLVIPAKNGHEAVEKALKERPQLILMDIMMPGMDGREAT